MVVATVTMCGGYLYRETPSGDVTKGYGYNVAAAAPSQGCPQSRGKSLWITWVFQPFLKRCQLVAPTVAFLIGMRASGRILNREELFPLLAAAALPAAPLRVTAHQAFFGIRSIGSPAIRCKLMLDRIDDAAEGT
jgi:hypothetical protein